MMYIVCIRLLYAQAYNKANGQKYTKYAIGYLDHQAKGESGRQQEELGQQDYLDDEDGSRLVGEAAGPPSVLRRLRSSLLHGQEKY